MKYLIILLVILAAIGGYCLGSIDVGQGKASYVPPATIDHIIAAQKAARDSHQRITDDPQFRQRLTLYGIEIGTIRDHKEWVRLYDMTIELLEGLKQ